jgi:hypothetical protein
MATSSESAKAVIIDTSSGSTSSGSTSGVKSPIVIDLGRKRRKQVRQLRRGTGELMEEINECIEELRLAGTVSGLSQPVVVIVRERSRSMRKMFPFP